MITFRVPNNLPGREMPHFVAHVKIVAEDLKAEK
jgi:hypothetical protein